MFLVRFMMILVRDLAYGAEVEEILLQKNRRLPLTCGSRSQGNWLG